MFNFVAGKGSCWKREAMEKIGIQYIDLFLQPLSHPKMPLLNAASKARNVQSIVNANQGGGSKKAGSPPTVGKEWHIHEYLSYHNTHPLSVWRRTVKTVLSKNLPIGTAYNIKNR